MKHILFTFLGSLLLSLSSVLQAGIPDWTITPSNFQYSMNGTLRVKMDSVFFNAADTRIGVFVGSELRGVVTSATMMSGNAFFPITIYSNLSSGEIMHFKVYNAARDTIEEADELPVFNRNETLGNIASPFILTLHPSCTAPVITSCARDTTIDTDAGLCGAAYEYAPSFSGSPAPAFSYSFTGATEASDDGTGSGSFFNKGVTTVKLIADNGCKPKDSCSFTITVNDNEMPTIHCGPPIEQSNDDGLCSATVNFMEPVGSDNCLPTMTAQIEGLNSGSVFPVGTTTNVFQVTDELGNSSTCSLLITVKDTELPKIHCENNIFKENDLGECNAQITFQTPIGTDNCDGANTILLSGLASGSNFPVGETVVSFEVKDASGNKNSCSFTVNVKDIEKPEIHCIQHAIRNTDQGGCSYKVISSEFNLAASLENCGIPDLNYTLEGATNGQGTGTLSGVEFKKGLTTVYWTAVDATGNSSSCSFEVTVNDNQAPMINCPAAVNVFAAQGQNTVLAASVVLGSPTVTDNCGTPNAITNNAPLEYPLGITQVNWIVKDADNNSSSCNQQVNVYVYSSYCDYPRDVIHYDTTQNGATIKWKEVNSAAGYSLRLRKQFSPGIYGPWTNWIPSNGYGASHQFTSLLTNSFYHCQVRTECGLGYSIFINEWFHTLP